MQAIEVNIKINKPLLTVYRAYTNPLNMTKWSKNLERFEPIKGEFGETGALAHLHYKQKGKEYVFEDKLLHLVPGKKIISEVSGGGLVAGVTTLFNHDDNQTSLTIIWNGKTKNFISNLMLSIVKRKIKKNIKEELLLFKSLVEEHGEIF